MGMASNWVRHVNFWIWTNKYLLYYQFIATNYVPDCWFTPQGSLVYFRRMYHWIICVPAIGPNTIWDTFPLLFPLQSLKWTKVVFNPSCLFASLSEFLFQGSIYVEAHCGGGSEPTIRERNNFNQEI
jgi:hypothetical protein